jgi:prepilin-type processing-associated H-X9-DG protein
MGDDRYEVGPVEVVVVVVAFLAVFFLMLPGVQTSRGGRRTDCTNNLYQLGLATIRAGENQRFVPGWRNASPDKDDAPGVNTVSWSVVVLPYMERNDIYRKWRDGKPDAPAITFFICPSSPPDTAGEPTLSYAGNVGSGSNARKWDGVMLDTTDSDAGRMSFGEISAADGMAVTAMLTERCGSGDTRKSLPLHQYWWDRRGLTVPNESEPFFENVAAHQAFDPSPRPGIGITGKPPAGMKIINNTTENSAPGFWSQPSSNHAGGVVMVFCDGHTVFVRDSIDAAVYAQLLSSNSKKASAVSRVDWGADSHPVLKHSDYK